MEPINLQRIILANFQSRIFEFLTNKTQYYTFLIQWLIIYYTEFCFLFKITEFIMVLYNFKISEWISKNKTNYKIIRVDDSHNFFVPLIITLGRRHNIIHA